MEQQCKCKPPISPPSATARDLLRQQRVLCHRENVITMGLSVPPRHPRQTMSDILDLNVERRRIEEIEPAPRQHALPGPRCRAVGEDGYGGVGRAPRHFATGRSRCRHGPQLSRLAATRLQPSTSTNKTSSNGSDTTTDGSIIMPIDISTEATTRSITRKGRNSRNSISKARLQLMSSWAR